MRRVLDLMAILMWGWLSAAAVTPTMADSPADWRWSNPRPHGANIAAMAYRFGLTVSVAERGQVYSSEDLSTWTPHHTGTDRDLRAVTFHGTRLVITGEAGTVVYGDSLSSLVYVDLGTTDWLEGVASSESLLVAVGDAAAIYTSANGVNWTRQPPGPINQWLRDVAYGNGLFVAVGEQGLIAASADGTNWVIKPSGTTRHLNDVKFFDGHFWVVGDAGELLTAPSTASGWTRLTSGATNRLSAVAGTSANLLVAGDSELRRREAGTWMNELSTNNAQPAASWDYRSALWEGSLFLVGGRSGLLSEGFATNTASPYVWVQRQPSIRNWLWEVQRMPDFYIAVGHRGTILTSGRGVDWQLEYTPPPAQDAVLLGVGGTSNVLLVAGSSGTLLRSVGHPELLVTTNSSGATETNLVTSLGIDWEPVTPSPTSNDLQGVTVHGQTFVVSGAQGTLLTSADTTNWTAHPSATAVYLSGVASYPGGVIAVGQSGTLLHSADLAHWTPISTGLTNWIFRVRYLHDQLIAVGQGGVILTSSDGLAWTRQTSGTTAWLNDVTWSADSFYVVGNQGTLLVSSNATVWTLRSTLTWKSLLAATQHEGQLIAAGVEGGILRRQLVPLTDPVEFVSFAHREGFNVFSLRGRPDQVFCIERSRDLLGWTPGPLLEFIDNTGTLLVVEEVGTNQAPAEYFRARLDDPTLRSE